MKELTGTKVDVCYVDLGYRGHGIEDTKVFISGQKRGVSRRVKKELKRRSVIEPEIEHMKNDSRSERCFLKGESGDTIDIIMSAAGHNLRKILNKLRLFWFKVLSSFLQQLFFVGYKIRLNPA